VNFFLRREAHHPYSVFLSCSTEGQICPKAAWIDHEKHMLWRTFLIKQFQLLDLQLWRKIFRDDSTSALNTSLVRISKTLRNMKSSRLYLRQFVTNRTQPPTAVAAVTVENCAEPPKTDKTVDFRLRNESMDVAKREHQNWPIAF